MKELYMLRDGMNVERFHTIPSAGRQTVGHHTANIIGLLFLAYRPSFPPVALIHAALVHDMAEAVLGDMPATAKRMTEPLSRNDLGDIIEYIEEKILADTIWFPQPLTTVEHAVLKVCDCLELVLYLNERIAAGCFDRRVRSMQTNALLYLHAEFKEVGQGAVRDNLNKLIQEATNEQVS